jgi:glycosyltransferase involved in cell wall biosynthesis
MRILHWVAIQASAVVVFQYRDAPRVIFGEDSAARYASRFHAILPGVDTDALAAAADMRRRRLSRRPGDRFRILQVGTICERKNQRFLVGLLARMTREYEFDQWSLELIYDENQDEGFQSLLEELGISARVKLLGWRTDAAELMADADVLAMPSLDEGVPNAAQEAMVIGVPVIASRAGGLPEILNGQAGGWSIPLEEESEWIEVLRRCEMDPQLCERVGSEGREFAVGAFRSEHWGEQYADVMDKGSAGAGPRGEFDG